MINVEMKLEGDKLTIAVDLGADFGPSKSGKSRIIASTEGNATVKTNKGDIKVGLNVYKTER